MFCKTASIWPNLILFPHLFAWFYSPPCHERRLCGICKLLNPFQPNDRGKFSISSWTRYNKYLVGEDRVTFCYRVRGMLVVTEFFMKNSNKAENMWHGSLAFNMFGTLSEPEWHRTGAQSVLWKIQWSNRFCTGQYGHVSHLLWFLLRGRYYTWSFLELIWLDWQNSHMRKEGQQVTGVDAIMLQSLIYSYCHLVFPLLQWHRFHLIHYNVSSTLMS